MDGVERVMVLGIFIVIVLILGVLAWDASNEDPAAVLTTGTDGGSGVSTADLDQAGSLQGRRATRRDELDQGPRSIAEEVAERRAQVADSTRRTGQPTQRPPGRVAQALTEESEHSDAAPTLNANSPTSLKLSSTVAVPSTKSQADRYVVKEGDTAWRIAATHYGTGDMKAFLNMIQASNPGADLEQLSLGQVLLLPVAAPAEALLRSPEERAAVGEGRTYKVQEGDTLSSISLDQLGTAKRWEEIYTLNRHVLTSASQVAAGLTLVLPEE